MSQSPLGLQDSKMADSAKKQRPQSGAGRPSNANVTNTLQAGSTRSPSRTSTTSASGAGGTPSRARSIKGGPVSAKATVRKPGGPSSLSNSTSALDDDAEQDARAETLALVEDLKERLKKAEEASEEYCKQVEVIQARLNESHKEQGNLEEKAHEDEERLEGLANEKRELTKQKRELESIYEAERASWMREKDEASLREEELQKSLQRVKENMVVRDVRSLDVEGRPGLSRTCASKFQRIQCASTDILQRACEAMTSLQASRTVSLRHRYNAAIPVAPTRNWSCKRTRSLNPCDWNWPRHKLNWLR